MMAIPLVFLLTILLAFHHEISAIDPDTGLTTVQMIESHGYVAESHDITTEDGYILTYHRIPHGKDNTSDPKPPVLLMHGAGCSSADYVNMGPDWSLAYILADLGHDVWIGNSRGNAWARKHTTLDIETDAEQFFDFSWHEMGYYDLPAAIDYILKTTGDDGLYYVGHSQGTSVFLVLATTRPEYNKKIKLASLMAPIASIEHQTGALQLVGKYIYEIEKILHDLKIYEIPLIDQIREIGSLLCQQDLFYGLCKEIIFQAVGADDSQIDREKVPVLFTNTPSNNAMKPFYHLGQLVRNGGFSQYDHGTEKNLEIYGTETPPPYDLSLVSAPVALYYGKNDGAVNILDAAELASKLPNVADNYTVPYDLFNHIDFLWAIDVKKLLYNELIEVLEKY